MAGREIPPRFLPRSRTPLSNRHSEPSPPRRTRGKGLSLRKRSSRLIRNHGFWPRFTRSRRTRQWKWGLTIAPSITPRPRSKSCRKTRCFWFRLPVFRRNAACSTRRSRTAAKRWMNWTGFCPRLPSRRKNGRSLSSNCARHATLRWGGRKYRKRSPPRRARHATSCCARPLRISPAPGNATGATRKFPTSRAWPVCRATMRVRRLRNSPRLTGWAGRSKQNPFSNCKRFTGPRGRAFHQLFRVCQVAARPAGASFVAQSRCLHGASSRLRRFRRLPPVPP